MAKIIAADEFLEEFAGQGSKIFHNRDRDGVAYPSLIVKKAMIEFAKRHVRKALKRAAKAAAFVPRSCKEDEYAIDPDSIRNSYPENLIT